MSRPGHILLPKKVPLSLPQTSGQPRGGGLRRGGSFPAPHSLPERLEPLRRVSVTGPSGRCGFAHLPPDLGFQRGLVRKELFAVQN